eukprot:Phypoly_transcript_12697.p1 GENE.Phypoly_transcript_12697~~Phypoly_transcript_12697.p1  ORF type:complete len:321 (+),score=49.87 Phypoly_transcript_12697:97-1059(+)
MGALCMLLVFVLCVLPTFTLAAANSTTINVALLQMMPSKDNLTANIEIATAFCTKAAAQGADIALFPEMWNIGYDIMYPGYDPNNQSGHMAWLELGVTTNSSYVQHFQDLAAQLNMAIGVTYMEQYNPKPRNTISLIDRFGNIVLTYSKIHTCDWLPAEGSTFPGDGFYVTELNTAKGNLSVGAMICFDREQPESARILMIKGAELILTPNACILAQVQINQFQTRAFENGVVVALTNYPAPYQNGWSVAYNADASTLVEAGGDEGIYMASFDLVELRAFRAQTAHGDAFRRPYMYSAISTLQKQADFAAPNFFHRDRLF